MTGAKEDKEKQITNGMWLLSKFLDKDLIKRIPSRDLFDSDLSKVFGEDESSLLQILVACSGDYNLVKHVLEMGANVNYLNSCGRDALHGAVSRMTTSSFEMTACLLFAGANPNVSANNNPNESYPGITALHIAAGWNKNPEITRMLLVAGANPNAQDADGNTPLHLLAYESMSAQNEYYLLKNGADPTIRNKDGELYCNKYLVWHSYDRWA